jgi:hypothetical protein
MRITLPLSLIVGLLLIGGCTRRAPGASPSTSEQRAPAVAAAGGEGATVPPPVSPVANGTVSPALPNGAAPPAQDRVFEKGVVIDNLVVYAVTSRAQIDVGPLITLDDALAQGAAEVREVDGGGSVNTLVIENKGTVPIFVLAGTVVKGGKQDRQIGQDFVIDGKQTSQVDAFCVEHGRWNAQRQGQGTNGKFITSDVVATSKVRAAGQYKKDQSEVWSKVGESNAAHKKVSASDTFLASVDDAQIARDRAALAARIQGVIDGVTPAGNVVGVAYAVDGEVRGVRWFSHHKVLVMVEKKLANGIAQEAMTAKAEAAAAKRPPSSAPPPPPAAVAKFVNDVEREQIKEQRDTPAANTNDYKESSDAFGSSVMLKGAGKPKAPLTKDYTKK